MNQSNLLSVAIPTYKRPELLDKGIESIFNSAKASGIEVLVMDDSLGNGNDWVYQKHLALGRNLRVIRNPVNLGIDANICACIEHAASDYVWLFGEDDLMRLEAVDQALAAIERDAQAPFVFANYAYITADHKKIFREKSVEIRAGQMEFKEFFENYLWSAGFIGGCIIRRSNFLATRYKEFIGTYYAHVAGICLASHNKNITVIERPLVGNRVGDATTFTWSADSYGVFQGWRDLLRMLQSEFGADSFKRAFQSHIDAHGYLRLKFLLGKKADGLLTPADVQILANGDTSPEEKQRIRFVAFCVPRFFCIALRKTYASARRMNLPDFQL
ncbi:glycosyltransferase [Duganella sp. FT27W]|uniref:glycosyltransferase family 2 protein n=1 Tax=Duganella sp. FT27W TaxID=2654636 RepID=UPI00128CE34F|nr:glycosyltransferase [Duganella sp. FT27W]MPQ57138.1 glycosyltransferase [Duganella sp. FT27W]